MISYANLPKTSRLTSTLRQDSPETFNCSLTLQLLSLTKEVNFVYDSKTPPVIACTDVRSVIDPAIMVRVAVVASTSRLRRNF